MFPTFTTLRAQLRQVIADRMTQGHATDGLEDALVALPDSYDALYAFAERLSAPLRAVALAAREADGGVAPANNV